MPRIASVSGAAIVVYAGHNNPPPRVLRDVLGWAAGHGAERWR